MNEIWLKPGNLIRFGGVCWVVDSWHSYKGERSVHLTRGNQREFARLPYEILLAKAEPVTQGE